MTGVKRRVLTTDDLMHKQEGPSRKRLRSTMAIGKRHMEWGHESSGRESVGSSNESEGGSQDENGLEDELSRRNGDETESEDEEESTLLLPESFNFSRIASTSRGHSSTSSILPKPSANTFQSLGVSAPLQAALSSMSIRTPTGVQAACIPPLLAGGSFT